jgi:hypothetical protein
VSEGPSCLRSIVCAHVRYALPASAMHSLLSAAWEYIMSDFLPCRRVYQLADDIAVSSPGLACAACCVKSCVCAVHRWLAP